MLVYIERILFDEPLGLILTPSAPGIRSFKLSKKFWWINTFCKLYSNFLFVRQRLTVEQALNHEWFKKWDIKAKIVELEQSIISATSKITATSEETVAKVDITTSNNNENKNESAQQVETNSILTTTTTTYFHYHSKLPNPNLTLHIYNHVVVDDTNDNNNKSLKISNNNNNELSTNSIATAAL